MENYQLANKAVRKKMKEAKEKWIDDPCVAIEQEMANRVDKVAGGTSPKERQFKTMQQLQDYQPYQPPQQSNASSHSEQTEVKGRGNSCGGTSWLPSRP
ncbi:hypothetical protein ElyMa_005755700 [Elysia marginata]|uniref:Uncharacterized protein n=1 Tax=Elysia marginata TaxID=1093978 RepID=A0AAV4FNU3_9GAST|nr:hypothetical protein ElyMa_005755700 [Elysia marginata]